MRKSPHGVRHASCLLSGKSDPKWPVRSKTCSSRKTREYISEVFPIRALHFAP